MKQDDHESPDLSNSPQSILTNREIEVLKLIVQGHKSQVIADWLFISIHTVNFHRKNIRIKLSINSVGEMIRYPYQHQLI